MQLTIERKLILLFGIMAILFTGFSFYVWNDLKEFESDIERARVIQEEILIAKDLQLQIINVWQFVTDASLTKDREVIEEEARPNFNEAKLSIDRFVQIGDEIEHADDLIILKQDLDKMWQTGIKMFEAYVKDWDQGNVIMEEFDVISDKIITKVEELVAEENSEGEEATEEMLIMVETSLKVVTYVLVAGVLIGLGILFFLRTLGKSITQPLSLMVKATNEVAAGNLSVDISGIKVKNEVGTLAHNFNEMLHALRKLIGDVKEGVELLASSTEEMSASSTQIVEGAREQDMKSSQVATASQELSATIVDVAQNASSASESAKGANEVAAKGSEIVEKSIESINGIAETSEDTARVIEMLGNRSNEVGAIIQVIEEIAGQTNLLALNAAIEAARAGEQGRGFAVVADEVRKLAEKTTDATKQISETINVIQSDTGSALSIMNNEMEAVQSGVSHARDAEAALKDILDRVGKVDSMIENIAIASEEQSTAAEQISSDIESVAGISKDTSSSAEQISTASQDIARLASTLSDSISVFVLSGDNRSTALSKAAVNADSKGDRNRITT